MSATYTTAALLGGAATLALDLVVLRTRLVTRRAYWTAYAICVFFQVIVNGILTGRDIVRYAPNAILGWRFAYAPVEDLVFGWALLTSTLSLWVWWERRLGPGPAAGEPPPRAEAG